MPKITKIDKDTFDVTVTEAVETVHRVTLSDEYHQELTSGEISKEQLIEKAFRFLLRRESNVEILREFTLETIAQYFPDFSLEIKKLF